MSTTLSSRTFEENTKILSLEFQEPKSVTKIDTYHHSNDKTVHLLCYHMKTNLLNLVLSKLFSGQVNCIDWIHLDLRFSLITINYKQCNSLNFKSPPFYMATRLYNLLTWCYIIWHTMNRGYIFNVPQTLHENHLSKWSLS